jgi:hypothetical protein
MTNAIPLYHSEIAPPDIRGRLISFLKTLEEDLKDKILN